MKSNNRNIITIRSKFIALNLLILFILMSISVYGQEYRIPITINNAGNTNSKTLHFGGHRDATYCIDTELGEEAQPPKPPIEVFDVRFIDTRSLAGRCMDDGLLLDLRSWLTTVKKDTFRISLQSGSPGYPLTITWPSDLSVYFTSAELREVGGSQILNMLTTNSITITEDVVLSVRIFTEVKKIMEPPIIKTPVNNATRVQIPTTFTWTSSENAAFYRLQVSEDSTFATIFFDNSSIADTFKVVNGLPNKAIYFWRVRAINSGASSAWGTTWKIKTIGPTPSIPNLLNPANGAFDESITPWLNWNVSQNTESYLLQLSLSSTFTTLVYEESLFTDTAKMVGPLNYNTTYYWRVAGFAEDFGYGTYSDIRNFKTLLIPPDQVILFSPLNNADSVVPNPQLIWGAAPRATKYHLQVATDTGFNSLIFDNSNIATTSQTMGPLNSFTKYYWRVRGWNTVGFGNYSAVWNFTTLREEPPVQPILVEPLSGARNVPLTPRLKWLKTKDAVSYHLQVAIDSFFVTKVFVDSNITDTSRIIGTPFTQSTKYFWRVRAKNAAGIGSFSLVWNLRTLGDEAPRWLSPFIALETGIARDTVFFGVHPSATHGIDPPLGEYELPPIDDGMFDLRWVSPPRRPGVLGEGTRINYTPFVNFTQVDTYKVRFQPGTGSYPINLSWSSAFIRGTCDSMRLKDSLGGSIMNVRMDVSPSTVLSDASISSLLIIMWHPRPLGIKIEGKEVPKEFALYPNYPNPFNPSTQVRFSIMKASYASLHIYNSLGEKVRTLAENYFYPGTYSVEWDGKNDEQYLLSSGVYFARMVVNNRTENSLDDISLVATQRMMLIK